VRDHKHEWIGALECSGCYDQLAAEDVEELVEAAKKADELLAGMWSYNEAGLCILLTAMAAISVGAVLIWALTKLP
jgi:hypothetical protein